MVGPTFLARSKVCQCLLAAVALGACDRAPPPPPAPERLVLYGARVARDGATLRAERLALGRTERTATGLSLALDEGFRIEAATATAAGNDAWRLARVTAEDPAGRRLESARAEWDGRSLRSDAATRLTGDNFRGQARGWIYDRAERRLQLRGPVALKLSLDGARASPAGQPR